MIKSILKRASFTRLERVIALIICISGLYLTTVSYVLASEKENDSQIFNLGEVVVTSHEEKKESPTSITIITAEDIERYGASSFADVLRGIPGLVCQQGRSRNEYYVSMRGFKQENVLILLDGVPLNIPWEGLLNLADIPVHNIAAIKVIKGNASVLYGANAMGGIINIITRRGTEKLDLSASYQISDYNTHHIQATHGWKVGNFSYTLGMSHKESDGFKMADEFSLPEDVINSMAASPTQPASLNNTPIAPDDGRRESSDYDRNSLTFTGTVDITPDDSIGLSFEYYDHEYGVPPGPLYKETGSGRFYYYPRYWRLSDWERFTFNLIGESKISEDWRIKGRFFYDSYEYEMNIYDDDTYPSTIKVESSCNAYYDSDNKTLVNKEHCSSKWWMRDFEKK